MAKSSSFSAKVKAELKECVFKEGLNASVKGFTSRTKEYNIDENNRILLASYFFEKGSMTNPSKSYHLEFVCDNDGEALKIADLLSYYEIGAGKIRRKSYTVVYIKGGEHISRLLSLMGAHKSLMDMENDRIRRELRGAVNRRVNCDSANINKTVNASEAQMEAINFLEEKGELNRLPKALRDAARARAAQPEATLQELADSMYPPLGKSGMNHRLQKLMDLYRQLKYEG